MKVVVFSGIQKPTDAISTEDIYGTPQLYSYYLRKEMEKRGIETIPCRCPSVNSGVKEYEALTIPEGDHLISVEQRGIYNRKQHPILLKNMKKSISGKITTICDNNDIIGDEDALFYAVPAPKKPKSIYVGWAVDHTMCFPQKDPNVLRILIDHSHYNENGIDLSKQIFKDVMNFSNSYKERPVIVRRFISGGVETCDANSKPEIYNRSGLTFKDACSEYRKSDIFIVTHPESMGLSVLESAAAGALVLSPNDFIRHELLHDLNHLTFQRGIPWGTALNMIDHKESYRRTLKYNWSDVVDKMIKEFNR